MEKRETERCNQRQVTLTGERRGMNMTEVKEEDDDEEKKSRQNDNKRVTAALKVFPFNSVTFTNSSKDIFTFLNDDDDLFTFI